MEISDNIIYAVVIDTPKYLGSITVTNGNIGHLVKFELKENNYQTKQVTVSKFHIKECASYVAGTGTDILLLDGYDVNYNWLFTLKCDMVGKLTYHEYQQPEVLAEDDTNQPSETPTQEGNYRDSIIYQKARKILAMDDNADIDTDPNDKNHGIMLDVIRRINSGVTEVQLVKEFPVIRSIVRMIYNAYNRVLQAKQNLSINKDTNAYQPHMVSDTMLVQHTIVSIYEDEMLPGIKKLIEDGTTVPDLSTSAKISTYEATWMIWFAQQYMIIVGKYGFSLRLSNIRYSDDASKRQAILDIHKVASDIDSNIGFACSIAKTTGLDVDLIKMVAHICVANSLHYSTAANTPELFSIIVRIIYHDILPINLKELIRKGKSVEEIGKEMPSLASSDGKFLEWAIWFVRQYDEAVKKALEPNDEYSLLVKSLIQRLNALQ